ncbi:MAG TPA: MFS transporter [Candidatus Saccharimonadales bacterium]|jgi:EmrB/QacA subfamily drug resistance transporter|nr:MFS transporter [Candidatus Saccharimonadales bacterium]
MNKQQRLVLIVSILASFVAFLDGSVINVALPAIARELGGGLVAQQWVVDAYLLTLGSFILIAGSLSDLFGRKKVLAAGLVGFGIASVLCAVAPTSTFLIVARALQGVAGALLVPSSLALIIATFSGPGQGKAIGTWTAWTGIAFVVGPLLGGFLVDVSSWRLVFAINIIPIAITLWLMRLLRQPEVRKHAHVDVVGAILCALGLAGPVYALIEQPHFGWSSPFVYVPLVSGVAALVYFLWHEHRTAYPMLPLALFGVRNFSVGNIATVAIYAGLSVATFLIAVFIQQVGGYSALGAGLALLPITGVMFILAPRFGALAGKYGPRFFMAVGPIVGGTGFLLMLRVDQTVAYWTRLLPGVLVFALGLAMTVAPLTTAILGSIDKGHAGIGSAVNNAVSRIAGLLAIAGVGVVTGANLNVAGFHRGLIMTAGLLIAGGVISAIGIQNQNRALK